MSCSQSKGMCGRQKSIGNRQELLCSLVLMEVITGSLFYTYLLESSRAPCTQPVHQYESSPHHSRHSPSAGLGRSVLCSSAAEHHHQCRAELRDSKNRLILMCEPFICLSPIIINLTTAYSNIPSIPATGTSTSCFFVRTFQQSGFISYTLNIVHVNWTMCSTIIDNHFWIYF